MYRLVTIFLAAVLSSAVICNATDNPVALKTNLLYDALLNANLGMEVRLAPRWTLDISGNYNGWSLSHGRQWKHWLVQPEARLWTREAMKGHFFGAHLFGGQFNTSLNDARRQGWAAGVGVGYGYAWRFASHWGLEAEIAVGYARYAYDKFPCAVCGRKIAEREKNYVGPTKAVLNLVYYFGGSGKKPEPVVEEPVIIEPVVIAVDTAPKKAEFNFILVDVPASRTRSENLSGVAKVQFAVNSTEIALNNQDNIRELRSIVGKLDSIRGDLGMEIKSVEFTGYASPEGSYAANSRLAAARTAALRNYVQMVSNLPDSVVSVKSVAEDWDGLRKAVAASPLSDKDVLLEIIDSPREPDAKENALRRHTASWAYIKQNILPELRRTLFRIDYEHRYEEKETQTLELVNKAITKGDAEEAGRLLVDIPSSAEADYARGLVAALRGDYAEARAWLNRAKGRGVNEADDALRQIEVVERETSNNTEF